jgi:hypothetical protein
MKKHALIITLIFIFSSCTTTFERRISPGCIFGKVVLSDMNGNTLTNETITVSIPDKNISATCDEKGFFELDGIPTGTYIMSFKSETTEEYLKNGVQIYGGDVPADIGTLYLSQKSTGSITNLHIGMIGFTQKGVFGDVNYPNGSDDANVVVFFSSDSQVSKTNFQFCESTYTYNDSFSMNIDSYLQANMPGIDSVYIIAYLASTGNCNWNCNEYNMNCVDPTCCDTPSNTLLYIVNQ